MPSRGRALAGSDMGRAALTSPTEPPLWHATPWAELRATEPQQLGPRLTIPGHRTCHLQPSEHFCLGLVRTFSTGPQLHFEPCEVGIHL